MLLLNPFRFNSLVSTTFDPNFAGTGIVLSNGNTRATTSGSWKTVLGTTGKSGSGKWQFEVECVISSGNPLAGIADKTTIPAILNNYLGFTGPNAISHASSTIYKALSSAGVESGTQRTWSAANDVLTVALDLDTNNVTFYINGVQSRSLTLPPGVTWYPATSSELNSLMQLRTKALEYPVSGYSNWDASLPTEDPLWMNVASLLHFNGTEGSTTFVDEKSNTWTVNSGTPTITTSGIFDSSLNCPQHASTISNITTSLPVGLQIGTTQDFTAECFVRLSSLPSSGYNTIFFKLVGGISYDIGIYAGTTWNIWVNGSGLNGAGTTPTPQLNTTYHIAIVRQSGNVSLFVNGNRQAAPFAGGSTGVTALYVGHSSISWSVPSGIKIDEFRVTKGVARYTANFTPPTMEFPNS